MALTLTFDVAMAGLAMTLAHFAMIYSDAEVRAFPVQAWLIATTTFMLAAAAGFVIGGVHRQVWRHMGAPDVVRLVQGIALAVFPTCRSWSRSTAA